MSFSQFFSALQESQFNLIETYSKAPNETLVVIGLIVVIIAVVYFLIYSSVKVSTTLKLVDNIQDCKSYEEIDEKLAKLIVELPKRGLKVADLLNQTKEHILFRTSRFLTNMSIKEKIEKYQEISKKYSKMAMNSKKFNNNELTQFFESKSSELLEINLNEEIAYYYENTYFDEKEVENVNAVVKYANSLKNPDLILDPMIKTVNKFSFGYNLDLYKFIEKLTKEESKQIFEKLTQNIKELFESGESEISINILDYLIQKDEKQKVYDYISSLKLASYLQQLYNLYFNRKDDLNLDLAFIANPTKINNDYKKYLDESLTSNWRDSKHIEYVSKSTRVIEVLGHMEFRTLIERVDNIKIETENRKMIEEALAIAKRAETIALEAKSLNKRPVIMSAAINSKKVENSN